MAYTTSYCILAVRWGIGLCPALIGISICLQDWQTRSGNAQKNLSTVYFPNWMIMRKKTNETIRELSRYTYDWITSYIPTLRTNSSHTTRNYRIAVNLFISYLEEIGFNESNFNTDCFSANRVNEWLRWLKENRKCSNETCNCRLASLKCLIKYFGIRNTTYRFLYQDVSDSVKHLKEPKRKVIGLTRDAVKAIFSIPNTKTAKGLRDLTLMELEYGTATRIDEVLSLKISQICLHADKPYITVIGKGSKIRSAYLMSGLVETLKRYIKIFHGERPNADDYLFYSSWHGEKTKLSQEAIRKRLRMYAIKAHELCEDVPLDLHSHMWRHAKATHWLEDGINIVEISKLLGHESIETTMKYQDITTKQQLAALATLEEEKNSSTIKLWKLPNAGNIRDYFNFV